MTQSKKAPEIRFRGFTDDWEQRKLLDCIQKITDFRGRTPKKLGMDWSEEGYLALSALNVKDGYIDFNQDVHYGNQELYDKWMTGNELHKGQVLFTTEAPMGYVAQVPDNRRYILSQRVIAFDVKDNLLTENFLATVLRTPTVFAYLTALSSGGTAKGVSQKSLSSVEIRLPKDLKEQKIIADTFSNLDHLITLHQRKHKKLLNIKKSMLEKMFPKAGEVVPEIRFKGFTDAWEQRKLSDIGEVITGSTPSTQHPEYYSEDGIPWVTPTDITENVISDTLRKLSDIGARVCRVAPKETILVTCIASIGKNTMLANTGGFNQQINGLVPDKKKYDPYFLLTESFHWSAKMKRDAAAGTMQIVNKNEFSAIETCMPVLLEQKAIGAYFLQIDNLITLHQRKLKKLETIKKAMLEKMFV